VGPGIIRPRGGLGSGSSTTTSTTTFGAALPGPRAARGKTETKQPQSGARVPAPAPPPPPTRWKRRRMEDGTRAAGPPGRGSARPRLGDHARGLVARHPTWLVASQCSAAGPPARRGERTNKAAAPVTPLAVLKRRQSNASINRGRPGPDRLTCTYALTPRFVADESVSGGFNFQAFSLEKVWSKSVCFGSGMVKAFRCALRKAAHELGLQTKHTL